MFPDRHLVPAALAVLAVGAQAMAIGSVWPPAAMPAAALLWQTLAALLMASAVSRRLARRLDKSCIEVFIYGCIACLFVPVAGLAACCAAYAATALGPPAARGGKTDVHTVGPPEFTQRDDPGPMGERGANLRARAQSRLAREQDRIAAMRILKQHPTRDLADLWEGLLLDPSRKVRKFARQTVDDTRRALVDRIDRVRAELAVAATPGDRLGLCVLLAELHWELIYQGLENGQGLAQALDNVSRYAHEALNLNQKEPEMWYLLGRCALLRDDPDSAERFLQHARMCHFPVERLLPWLAEAAFLRHDYERVQKILDATGRAGSVPTLQPVVRYWA